MFSYQTTTYTCIVSSFSHPGFFCNMTKPSSTCAYGMNSSVANSARSIVPSRTGVWCVWKPDIVRGLPAWPTTSTACGMIKSRLQPLWKSKNHLADANRDRLALEVLIEGDKEARVHGSHEEVQHPVVLIENDYPCPSGILYDLKTTVRLTCFSIRKRHDRCQ